MKTTAWMGPSDGWGRRYARCLLLATAGIGAMALGGCKQTNRTEIVVGVATDLKAPAPLYQVELTAYRLANNVMGDVIAQQQFMISGQVSLQYGLPGTYAVYSDQGKPDRVRVVLVATDDQQRVVVQRTAVLNLVPGKTLFVRMGVVSACMGKLDCPSGDTCIDGRCAAEEIDSSTLPTYTPGLESQVECAGAVNFIDTGTNQQLPVSGAGCSSGDQCQDGMCRPKPAFVATAGAPATTRIGAVQIGSGLVTLADGSVLLAGGAGMDATAVLASAETYDPVTQTFTAAGSMSTPRLYYGEARLADGRVLIAGGINEGQAALASAEMYDPATRTFTPTRVPMTAARAFPGAVTLTDGRVLIVGGMNDIVSYSAGLVTYRGGLASAEVYDPATDTFTAMGGLTEGRAYPHVTATTAGGALVMCGAAMQVPRTSLERFDPATATFVPAAALPAGEPGCDSNVAELRDGRLLLTMNPPSGALWLLNPATGKFTQAPAPPVTPAGALVGVLTGGQVLYAGAGDQHAAAYLFDPTAGTFSVLKDSLVESRPGLMGAVLADGGALIVGANMDSAEVFHPPAASAAAH